LQPSPKRNKLPLIAGIFAIIAACICAFLGISFTVGVVRTPSYLVDPYSAEVGIFGLIGFAFGLIGGILTLKRRMFYLAIIGVALLIPEGVVLHIFGTAAGWVFGTPVILLAVLSIFFAASSRKEFTS